MSRIIVIRGLHRLIWTLAVAGILVPLLFASYWYPAQGVTGEADGTLTYVSRGEGFSFDYPQEWLLRTEKDYSGQTVRETVTFISEDGLAHGYFQVLRLTVPLADHVAKVKEELTPGYDSLSLVPKTVGDKDGYVLTYSRGSGATRRVITEFYFSKNNKVFKFNCFYPETNAKPYTDVFEAMLGSFAVQAGPAPEGE